MHELSIAQNIAASAQDEVRKADASRLVSIEIEVGELMQVEVDVLKEALELLMKGPKLAGAEVKLETAKASFSCNRCGREWGMDEAKKQLASVPDRLRVREPESVELPLHFMPYLYPAFASCPACGSSDAAVLSGEDIWIKRVTMK